MGPKKTTEKYTKKKYNDLGLGVKETSGVYRTLNKDGTFNVRKTNVPFLERINFFHSLVSMPWPRFLGLILVGYFVINTLFASIYAYRCRTPYGNEKSRCAYGAIYGSFFL